MPEPFLAESWSLAKHVFWLGDCPPARQLYRLNPAGLQLIGKSQSIPPIMGETLAARIAEGPLSVEQIIYIGIGICFELGYSHQQGISHGDITAENILVTPDT